MQYRIIAARLVAGVALTLASQIACAQMAPPPATYAPPAAVYAPPPMGYSGTSTPPAGYARTKTAAPSRFVANRLTPMRTGPREAFDIIAVLPPGTPVTTDGYVGGDWWQVQTRYGTGWVYSRDLSGS